MSGYAVILARHTAGEISAEIALAQILLTGVVPAPGALPPAIERLAQQHRGRLEPLAALARAGFDVGGEDALADTAALFDRLSTIAPEAAVAFYTFGDPAALAAATQELVAVIRAWVPTAGRTILDFGCGIGRIALALAGEAAHVIGIDVSAGMIAQAERRAAGLPNLRFIATDGQTLPLAPASIDLVVVGDAMPFLVQAGGDLLNRTIGEVRRVLRPGGDLLVFNWSYRGDTEADRAEAQAMADRHGFILQRAAERPFAIWDGIGYHLHVMA